MQPTELQLSAWTHTVLSDLTREAAHAGATLSPKWILTGPALANGTLRSDDDTAIRELDIWRNVFGVPGAIDTITYVHDGKVVRNWQVAVTVSGISLHMSAIVPASIEARPANTDEPFPVRVAGRALAVVVAA